MRFFIALEIPDEDKEELRDVQSKIKTLLPDLNLTDPDKLHLTLAFIGEQDDSLKESLVEVMNQASTNIHPFQITPAYVDGFPNIHSPHTLWVGVKGDIDKLMVVRERIKDGLENLHLPVDERRFVPHIAIGKLHGSKIRQNQEIAIQQIMSVSFKPINVSSIKLFESVPDQGLHRHNTLAEIKLS